MNEEEAEETADDDPVRGRAARRLPSNPVARVLIVPLIPFVFTWELLHALVTRGIPALGRALLALGRWSLVPLQALWDIGAAIVRVFWSGLRALGLRVWFTTRLVILLVWRPLRAMLIALRAVAVRLGMAVRALARTVWQGVRACGMVLKAFAVRIFVSIRAATKVLLRLLKEFGLAVAALLKRMYVALRHVVSLAVRWLLAVCRRAAALLRALLTPVLRGLALAGDWVWRIVSALVSTCAGAVWRLGAALGLRLLLLGKSVWSIASLLIRTMGQVMDQVCAWIASGAIQLMRTLARGLEQILRPLMQCMVQAMRIVGTWWTFLSRWCWRRMVAIASMAGRLFAPLAQGVAMLGRWTGNLLSALAHVCAVAVRRLGSALKLRLLLLVESAWLSASFLVRTTGKMLRWLALGALKLVRAVARAIARGVGRILSILLSLLRPLLRLVARAAARAMAFVRAVILGTFRFFTGIARAAFDALKWALRGTRSAVMALGHALRQVHLSVVETLRAVRSTISSKDTK